MGRDAGLTLDAINYALPHISLNTESVSAEDCDLQVAPYGGGELAETAARVAW